MLLTAAYLALLAIVAFGLKAPLDVHRIVRVGIAGLAVGFLAAYLNLYPGSVRGAVALLAIALLLSGLQLASAHRAPSRPLFARGPLLGAALILTLVLAGLFPYTAWGADSVQEPLYHDLEANRVEGPAPALRDVQDVRVVPWDFASQLLARGYGADAGWLDTAPNTLMRNTFPDTVRGEFIWVNAPVPETAKWLVGGRLSDKVVYVRNDAANLTPQVVPGTLHKQMEGAWWHDRVARFAENEGEFRYILEDVALQLDDDYRPHWIAYLARLDVRNQPHMEKLLVVDAVSGEERIYGVDEAPEWIEIVYPERYVYQWAGYWGQHREGFLYRWFNASGLVQPDDVTVRYIRLEGTTYWLLPMKQLASPQLGGYILINTRTGDATFYDRFDDTLVDYDTAVNQLNAIMASGQATQGQGAIRLTISEGYLYPIGMADGSVRDAYIFPLLEGLKVSRIAIIDAHDYTTKRVFANTIEDALSLFANGTATAPATPGANGNGNGGAPAAGEPQLLPVDDGTVQAGRAIVSLNGTLYRVTLGDLAGGNRLEPEREMDELELAIARANRGEEVALEVLVLGGQVVDVTYPGVTWGR